MTNQTFLQKNKANIPTPAQLELFRQQLKKYVTFSDVEWAIFEQHLDYATFKKKQHFLEAGTICNYYGFILKGSVRYYYIKDGLELTGYFNYENEFIGAYKSYLKGCVAVNNIQALEASEVIIVSKANMDLMLENPIIALKMERLGRLMAEYIVVCYEDRTNSFVTHTPEERYLELLETSKDILRKVPQHYIANYLGITAVSLSRIRSRVLRQK
jgi:CRP-like cAMP-binding protein